MDQEVKEKIERAQGLLKAFDRTIRSHRLYSENNPVLIKHQQDLFTIFTQFLSLYEELAVYVEPFQLKVDDEVAYLNQNQGESFAFRLFNDGIRSIKFRNGMTLDELSQFIGAINSGVGDTAKDSDAVTSFWEKEFDHIDYTVADMIMDETGSSDKSLDEKIEEVADPSMSMYHGAGGEADEDIYQDFKVTLNMQSVGKMFQDRCVMSANELAQIQQDIAESEQPERLVLDFVDMVLAMMHEEKDPDEYSRAAEALGNVLENNLMHGELGLARIVMDQVHRFPERPIVLTGIDPAILQKTLRILWPIRRVDMLIQSLNQEPKGTVEDIETLIRLIDPTTLPHLLKQVPTILDPNRRRIFCTGIAQLHRGDLGLFMPMLASKDPDTLRTALFIIASIKNDKVVDLLPPLIQHPDLAIRKEAIAILRNFKTPKTHRILVNLLNDSNFEIRVLALRILASSQDREIARQLMATMNREDFHQKPTQERKSYFHAIAKIAGDDFIPYLRDILATKTWFRKNEQEELYQFATYALGIIGTPQAKSALQDSTKSKNKTIQRLSITALRILEGSLPAKEAQP